MKASRIMTVHVTCITPETSLRHAHQLMKKLRVRHLPVVSQGLLCGIISDRDLLAHGTLVNGELVLPERATMQVMTFHPITCRAGTPVSQLATLMLEHRIDALPIVNSSNELVGLVTSSDLLALLREPEHVTDALPFSFQLRVADDLMVPAA